MSSHYEPPGQHHRDRGLDSAFGCFLVVMTAVGFVFCAVVVPILNEHEKLKQQCHQPACEHVTVEKEQEQD